MTEQKKKKTKRSRLGVFSRTPDEGNIVARIWVGQKFDGVGGVIEHAGGLHNLIDVAPPVVGEPVTTCRRVGAGVERCCCDECMLLSAAGMGHDQPVYGMPMKVCYPVRHPGALLELGKALRRAGVVSRRDVVPTQGEVDTEVDSVVSIHQQKL
jgi:hypothetical protein